MQTAAIVAANTVPLREELADIATLHYVEGPPMRDGTSHGSRPWWILGRNLEIDSRSDRWSETVSDDTFFIQVAESERMC